MVVQISNEYVGNGQTVLYSFTFPYISESDVRCSLDDVLTTKYKLANATTVEFNQPPANGVIIKIFRDTSIDTIDNTFFPGSAIRAKDLNDNFTQTLYVIQEADFNVDTAEEDAAAALQTAQEAKVESAEAKNTAASAQTTSTLALNTANQAASDASEAKTTAENAEEVAEAAAKAVDEVVLYSPVPNVAAIPANPGEEARVQVIDSTGIQNFSPLSGMPPGFVGDAGKQVKLTWNDSNSWLWNGYVVTDPDARYLQLTGGTVSGEVTADGGFVGNLTGNASTATTATSADTADYAQDSNKLDNLNSNQFLRSDIADNARGDLTFSANCKVTGSLGWNDNRSANFGSSNDASIYCNGLDMYLELQSTVGSFNITDRGTSRFALTRNTGDIAITGDLATPGTFKIQASGEQYPRSVIGRPLGQSALYGSTWSNFMYGGADSASLYLMTGTASSSSWKPNLDLGIQNAGAVTNCAQLLTRVNDSGIKLFLTNATNGFEITTRSTSGANKATAITFNSRTGTTEYPAGTISTKGEGNDASIVIASTNGSAPVAAFSTDTENIQTAVPMTSALESVKKLLPSVITLKNGTVVNSFPVDSVKETALFAVDSNEDKFDGVDHGRLVPLLTKAIQELIAKNEDLEARLNAINA